GARKAPFLELAREPPLASRHRFRSLLKPTQAARAVVTWGMNGSATRIERDTMGEMEVPEAALWGASTQRAVLNFPVSGEGLDPALVHAYGLIKWAAARANRELGVVPGELVDLIETAAAEVFEGKLDEHFVVDVFQTGSGTST